MLGSSHIRRGWRPAASLVLQLALTLSATVARAQSGDSLSSPPPASTAAGTTISPPRVGGYIQARTASVTDIGFNAFLNLSLIHI